MVIINIGSIRIPTASTEHMKNIIFSFFIIAISLSFPGCDLFFSREVKIGDLYGNYDSEFQGKYSEIIILNQDSTYFHICKFKDGTTFVDTSRWSFHKTHSTPYKVSLHNYRIYSVIGYDCFDEFRVTDSLFYFVDKFSLSASKLVSRVELKTVCSDVIDLQKL